MLSIRRIIFFHVKKQRSIGRIIFPQVNFFLRSLFWTQVFSEPYLSMYKHVIYYYISLWPDCKQLLCGLWSQGLAELERANQQRRELERGRSKRVSPSLSVFSLARLPRSLARNMLARAALLADWCKRVSCVLTMDVFAKTSLNCRNFSHLFFLPAGNTEIWRTKILTSISHFCNSFMSVRLFHLQEPWLRSKEFDKKKRRSIIQQLLKKKPTFFPHVTNQRRIQTLR